MRRVAQSRATITICICMLGVMVLALTASILFAFLSTSSHGKNTVYISSLGTIECSATAQANLYPGGTSEGTLQFQLATGDNMVKSVNLTNFRLTSFVIEWAGSSGTQSATFSTVANSKTNGASTNNTATVTTTAGDWVFRVGWTTGLGLTAGTGSNLTLYVTVPLGRANTDPAGTTMEGGSPTEGYLVGTVSSVKINFTIDVTPTA